MELGLWMGRIFLVGMTYCYPTGCCTATQQDEPALIWHVYRLLWLKFIDHTASSCCKDPIHYTPPLNLRLHWSTGSLNTSLSIYWGRWNLLDVLSILCRLLGAMRFVKREPWDLSQSGHSWHLPLSVLSSCAYLLRDLGISQIPGFPKVLKLHPGYTLGIASNPDVLGFPHAVPPSHLRLEPWGW